MGQVFTVDLRRVDPDVRRGRMYPLAIDGTLYVTTNNNLALRSTGRRAPATAGPPHPPAATATTGSAATPRAPAAPSSAARPEASAPAQVRRTPAGAAATRGTPPCPSPPARSPPPPSPRTPPSSAAPAIREPPRRVDQRRVLRQRHEPVPAVPSPSNSGTPSSAHSDPAPQASASTNSPQGVSRNNTGPSGVRVARHTVRRPASNTYAGSPGPLRTPRSPNADPPPAQPAKPAPPNSPTQSDPPHRQPPVEVLGSPDVLRIETLGHRLDTQL